MPDLPQMQEVLDRITDMPALPNVVARLTRLIADPKTTASDINAALSSDPGLVTKILKLVNSSYYGFSRRITTITNAVVILGFNQVRNLALSAFIFDKFAHSRKNPFDLDSFWRHSMGSAFVCARLARRVNPKLEEGAFICGLLHDLGKFIMAQNAPEHIVRVVELVQKRDILFHDAEKLCLGYDHTMLGSVIMERWNLPETLVNVVRNHHAPLEAPDNSITLCCITQVAEVVARALLMGNGGDRKIPRVLPEVWARTGLDWSQLDVIIHRAADEFAKSDAFFSTT